MPDPTSVSVLGGALRRHALTLLELGDDIEGAARRSRQPDGSTAERELLMRAAGEFDRLGRLLQTWATETTESAARTRRLEEEASAADLHLDGRLVLERPGPSRVDPAARLRARKRLQELLNRVTSADGRLLAQLGRELGASSAALVALSERARSGSP